ncbi:hypothetical protein QFC21_004912 [Naganishia friedmannii]|uniref:Uncharacterized protein n=1 Tax=Naganishia friedmannii TaxID=89922 RepID=A0ACC2VDP6_9TREE|nr:hypothetical protein QFC21_004912 [Naganishia friedmannii]
MGKEKVAIIGSGNWGSAIAKIAGTNASQQTDIFDASRIPMWVFEEEVNGKKLTEIINETHINEKYLPGITLPENIHATSDLDEVVKDATAFIFVLPHQFLGKAIESLKGKITPGSKGVTLIKGVDVSGDDIRIFAGTIEKELGISCSALSGANIADEGKSIRSISREVETKYFAAGKFSGMRIHGLTGLNEVAEIAPFFVKKRLSDTERRKMERCGGSCSIVEDVAGVSLCGALKKFALTGLKVHFYEDIVAVAAGFVDGLEWGDNAKAAIMRNGLLEMKHFCLEFFENVKAETFLQESAGVADLITSCIGGRNRKVAEAFVKTGKTFEDLEKELLNGQKLQGVATAKDINTFLKSKNRVEGYPLFEAVYQCAFEGRDVKTITKNL